MDFLFDASIDYWVLAKVTAVVTITASTVLGVFKEVGMYFMRKRIKEQMELEKIMKHPHFPVNQDYNEGP